MRSRQYYINNLRLLYGLKSFKYIQDDGHICIQINNATINLLNIMHIVQVKLYLVVTLKISKIDNKQNNLKKKTCRTAVSKRKQV